MAKIFDKLFFLGPMSLGDSFVVSGLAHHFGDQCEELHLPVFPKFYNTLRTLYQDCPHIKVVALEPYEFGENQYVEANKLSRILRPTSLNYTIINNTKLHPFWEIQNYDYYNVPYSVRYSKFKLPAGVDNSVELYEKLSNKNPYVLVHRCYSNYSNGLPIDTEGYRKSNNLPDLPIIEIREGITDNMMEFVELIRNATEIHCVPSSFQCLVDNMFNQTNAQLFYHDVRIDALMYVNSFWNDKRWSVVTYAEKF
jgi:hypothetical protein